MYAKIKVDFLSGVFLCLFSLIILFYLIPNYVDIRTFTELSPQFFPTVAGATLLGLSLLLMLKSFRSLRRHKEWAGLADLLVPRIKTAPRYEPFLSVLIIGLYLLGFQHIGFLISTPPAAALLMLVFGQMRRLRIAVVSLILSGSLYALFNFGLKVPL
jgi:putative tricarboxylic transport membrane protein